MDPGANYPVTLHETEGSLLAARYSEVRPATQSEIASAQLDREASL